MARRKVEVEVDPSAKNREEVLRNAHKAKLAAQVSASVNPIRKEELSTKLAKIEKDSANEQRRIELVARVDALPIFNMEVEEECDCGTHCGADPQLYGAEAVKANLQLRVQAALESAPEAPKKVKNRNYDWEALVAAGCNILDFTSAELQLWNLVQTNALTASAALEALGWDEWDD